VLAALKKAPKTIGDSLDRFRFREASQLMMNLARAGNKYLAEEEPWKLIKTAPERVQTIMYVAVQVAAGLSVLSEPFLPFSSKKLKNMVALPEACDWKQVGLKNELIPSQTQLGKSALLFSKIEDDAIQIQLDKLEATKLKNNEEALQVTPVKETVSFEDFTKLDLRVGTILSAEKVAKTKKLLALKVNIGSETRTIVSGIAEDYTPEEVVGKTVSVLVNLAPRTLRGVESQGMILMTENAEGKLVFVTPSEANSQPGFTIR
jgi:methionyl-tRNA synthetase